MSVFEKQILIKVYYPTGERIDTWDSFTFNGFTKELNGGLGECVIRLEKEFNYAGNDLLVGNEVEISVRDKDTISEPNDVGMRIIYRGYISLVEREAIGQKETVVVHLLGFYTRLSVDILKNGAQTTLYSDPAGFDLATPTAGDTGLLVRAILDRYIAETANSKISYDPADIPDTTIDVTYAFERKTYREAIEVMKSFSPEGTFYYINEVGRVKFGLKPTTPTHRFIFGRHFQQVKFEYSLEKLRNVVLTWNGEDGAGAIYKENSDANSISKYGRRAAIVDDFGIENVNAATALAAKFLAENKDPEVKVLCTIIDNNKDDNLGYDIESIQPGDTCSFAGFNVDLVESFRDNMLITEVKYYLDRVELKIEVVKSDLVDFQKFNSKEISEIISGGLVQVPESYT